MNISVAHLIVQFLKEAKVPYVFGLSGHSIFPLTDALYSEPDCQFVPVMHELSAAYMAAAYAKGTRNLGVCTASAGAGVSNLLTGVAYAYKESIPVIVLAADVSRSHAGKGASSWHEIPQREIFEPITKMGVTLENANDAPKILRQALTEATTGRKGPVYIGIRRNVQTQEIELSEPLRTDNRIAIQEPESSLLDRAAEELQRALAPIIIAGGGVYWARAEDELRELAELLSLPFGTSPSHKGLISEDHPQSIGVLGFGAFPFANAFCLESDLILAVGLTFSEGLTLGYGDKVIPPRAKIIHIDADPREFGKIYPCHLPILGDAKAALQGLIERLRSSGGRKRDPSRIDKLNREKNEWHAKLFGGRYADDSAISQWHIYRALKETIGEEAVLVGAGGTAEMFRRFVARSYAYHSGEMRAIGFGLSTSIGLSLAFSWRPVVCATGDGSFMLECQELATVAALKLPISIIVIRNDAYGNMKRDQIKHYDGRIIGTDLHLPDLCALAGAYGIEAETISQPKALLTAFQRALAVRKPVLLDVICPIEEI
jgi:acetolactate synthase I/II/III large subunit